MNKEHQAERKEKGSDLKYTGHMSGCPGIKQNERCICGARKAETGERIPARVVDKFPCYTNGDKLSAALFREDLKLRVQAEDARRQALNGGAK